MKLCLVSTDLQYADFPKLFWGPLEKKILFQCGDLELYIKPAAAEEIVFFSDILENDTYLFPFRE